MKGRLNSSRKVACAMCNATFTATHSQSKYCSDECRNEANRACWRRYGARNRNARQAYSKQHYRENRERVIERTKTYQKTPAGKRAQRVSDDRQREKFPEKYAARQAVLVALRSGRLVKQPCERCGAKKVHAHHDDYSKPLDVRWLCPRCHNQEHREDGMLKETEQRKAAVG